MLTYQSTFRNIGTCYSPSQSFLHFILQRCDFSIPFDKKNHFFEQRKDEFENLSRYTCWHTRVLSETSGRVALHRSASFILYCKGAILLGLLRGWLRGWLAIRWCFISGFTALFLTWVCIIRTGLSIKYQNKIKRSISSYFRKISPFAHAHAHNAHNPKASTILLVVFHQSGWILA